MNQSNMKSNISKRLLEEVLKQEELQENANLQQYRAAILNLSKHVSVYYYFFVPYHESESDDGQFHSHAYGNESGYLIEKNFLLQILQQLEEKFQLGIREYWKICLMALYPL